MMKRKDNVLVWLYADAASLLLGLQSVDPKSRWLIVGKFLGDDDSHQGIWLSIDRIEEWKEKSGDRGKMWRIKPSTCLIQWRFIITIQIKGQKKETTLGFEIQSEANSK